MPPSLPSPPPATHSPMTIDTLIVGAGSAGCALAWRLSADPRHRVAVVEAGGSDRRLFVAMPLGYGKLFHDPTVNWCFRAEPDPGLNGVADHWPRGRVLGGSSSINAMVWVRGHRGDYEDWGAVAPGWGWGECAAGVPGVGDFEGGADEWRGAGGPLHVQAGGRDVHPLIRRALRAAQGVGLAFNPDFNGASQEGVGFYGLTVRGGRRNSAARAFLRPAVRRGAVRVMTGAHATRLLWEGKRCVGVEVARGGCARGTASGPRGAVGGCGRDAAPPPPVGGGGGRGVARHGGVRGGAQPGGRGAPL
jgi:choline dehydrogenase